MNSLPESNRFRLNMLMKTRAIRWARRRRRDKITRLPKWNPGRWKHQPVIAGITKQTLLVLQNSFQNESFTASHHDSLFLQVFSCVIMTTYHFTFVVVQKKNNSVPISAVLSVLYLLYNENISHTIYLGPEKVFRTLLQDSTQTHCGIYPTYWCI